MAEQRTPGNEPALKRPDEIIEDLEIDEPASETVQGGGIQGDATDRGHDWIE